jgi:hypothetical protein
MKEWLATVNSQAVETKYSCPPSKYRPCFYLKALKNRKDPVRMSRTYGDT